MSTSPATNFQAAAAQVNVAGAQVKQAEAALSAAELDLKYTVIRSPVNGIVVARNVEVGQTIAASFATPNLFLIALDLTKMQVDTNVSESDIGGITEEKEATFTVDAYPGYQFSGMIRQVRLAPINVQNVVTYNVVVSVDNQDLRLKPGMTANVSIVVAQRDAVLKVPNAALRFTPPAAGQADRSTLDSKPVKEKGSRSWHEGSWRQSHNVETRTVRESLNPFASKRVFLMGWRRRSCRRSWLKERWWLWGSIDPKAIGVEAICLQGLGAADNGAPRAIVECSHP